MVFLSQWARNSNHFLFSRSAQPMLGGRPVFVQYSQHKELKTDAAHAIANEKAQVEFVLFGDHFCSEFCSCIYGNIYCRVLHSGSIVKCVACVTIFTFPFSTCQRRRFKRVRMAALVSWRDPTAKALVPASVAPPRVKRQFCT